MLHQPRVPPTGQRQAIEIQIKWREVLAQKQAMLDILAKTTGHSVEKLDKVRPSAQCSWQWLQAAHVVWWSPGGSRARICYSVGSRI